MTAERERQRRRGDALTENEVQLGIRLEGIVKCDEERRLADVLQHLPLGARVFGRLRLLDDGGLLQNLHGVQLPRIVTAHFPHQEHLAVGCRLK